MKIIFILLAILITSSAFSREIGETEITTEEGIEVYQEEKYYLLKKNVQILSDNFKLNADIVKIFFDKSLYDIREIEAKGNVIFDSLEYNVNGNGEFLYFKVLEEEIIIKGLKSKLVTDDINFFSDGIINVNNLSGKFYLKGKNSKLMNENTLVEAENIDGKINNIINQKQITYLHVDDKKNSYVKNLDTEMYAKKINFDNKSSTIELIGNVIIIRDGEKIKGDYGTLNTKNNSYKIKSNDRKKVIAIIQNNDE